MSGYGELAINGGISGCKDNLVTAGGLVVGNRASSKRRRKA